MGQGINTKVAQTVAKELKDYGVTIDMIKVKAANNLVSPNNCVTGGSTTSELTCNVSTPTLLLVLGKNPANKFRVNQVRSNLNSYSQLTQIS